MMMMMNSLTEIAAAIFAKTFYSYFYFSYFQNSGVCSVSPRLLSRMNHSVDAACGARSGRNALTLSCWLQQQITAPLFAASISSLDRWFARPPASYPSCTLAAPPGPRRAHHGRGRSGQLAGATTKATEARLAGFHHITAGPGAAASSVGRR